MADSFKPRGRGNGGIERVYDELPATGLRHKGLPERAGFFQRQFTGRGSPAILQATRAGLSGKSFNK